MSDEIVVKEGVVFDRELPPEDTLLGICFNVFDVGLQDTKFGPKPEVIIYFEIDVRFTKGDFAGKRMLVATRPFTAGLSKNSNLRKFLESWRGKTWEDGDPELKGFRLKANLKGKPALLKIVHNNGYADIAGVIKPPKGTPLFTLETDPSYVPKRVLNLLEKRLVEEKVNTDEVAERGWNKAEGPAGPQSTEKDLDIF